MSHSQTTAVMPSTSQQGSVERSPSIGHLTVRPEGLGPAEVHFSFERQEKRLGGAIGASILSHAAFLLLFVMLARLLPEAARQAILPDRLPSEIVWLAEPGPGGGGGGGGNQMKEPPKKVELPGKEKISVPAVKPPSMELEKPKEPEPEPQPQINIPAQTMAASTLTAPGVIESTQPAGTLSQGTGTGGGAGTGTGTGMGSGQGSGLGPGYGGGTGGGAYRPGNGVTLPRVLFEKKPAYTADAMRAKVQGIVLLECVVLPDGTVGQVDIIRSLDPTFGLDQEAIKAAKQWRFQPGTRFGEPVPVLVTIELQFTLR
jgi:protein TonB